MSDRFIVKKKEEAVLYPAAGTTILPYGTSGTTTTTSAGTIIGTGGLGNGWPITNTVPWNLFEGKYQIIDTKTNTVFVEFGLFFGEEDYNNLCKKINHLLAKELFDKEFLERLK